MTPVDHTWIEPQAKQGTIEYKGNVLHMRIYTDVAGYHDPRLPIIITGRLCALSRLLGNGVGFRVTQDLIEAPPDAWTDEFD